MIVLLPKVAKKAEALCRKLSEIRGPRPAQTHRLSALLFAHLLQIELDRTHRKSDIVIHDVDIPFQLGRVRQIIVTNHTTSRSGITQRGTM